MTIPIIGRMVDPRAAYMRAREAVLGGGKPEQRDLAAVVMMEFETIREILLDLQAMKARLDKLDPPPPAPPTEDAPPTEPTAPAAE